jgi:exonuclease III
MEIESINASSASKNDDALLESDASIQFIQESGLTKTLQASFDKEAREHGKKAIGSPLDPEHAKASAGVAAVTTKNLELYPAPEPTDDYKDAELTGRCKILCIDLGGTTLACANIYGWSGGEPGSKEAARTNDIITIVRMQFAKMKPGPKMICGDLNARTEALSTLQLMLDEEGWTDIGKDPRFCEGEIEQYTCHANVGVKESRIDYFITNQHLTPAVRKYRVVQEGKFPTHKPIRITIATNKMETRLTSSLNRQTLRSSSRRRLTRR